MTKYRVCDEMPRSFPRKTPGLIAQGDLAIGGGGRLRAKVLVFETAIHLRRWWSKDLRRGNIGKALGAVSDLMWQRLDFHGDDKEPVETIEYERKYFCVIGLCRNHCTMKILSHEAVHAGFAHARRKTRSAWQSEALKFDEEAVAYPAGEIAKGLVMFLEKAGIYEKTVMLTKKT